MSRIYNPTTTAPARMTSSSSVPPPGGVVRGNSVSSSNSGVVTTTCSGVGWTSRQTTHGSNDALRLVKVDSNPLSAKAKQTLSLLEQQNEWRKERRKEAAEGINPASVSASSSSSTSGDNWESSLSRWKSRRQSEPVYQPKVIDLTVQQIDIGLPSSSSSSRPKTLDQLMQQRESSTTSIGRYSYEPEDNNNTSKEHEQVRQQSTASISLQSTSTQSTNDQYSNARIISGVSAVRRRTAGDLYQRGGDVDQSSAMSPPRHRDDDDTIISLPRQSSAAHREIVPDTTSLPFELQQSYTPSPRDPCISYKRPSSITASPPSTADQVAAAPVWNDRTTAASKSDVDEQLADIEEHHRRHPTARRRHDEDRSLQYGDDAADNNDHVISMTSRDDVERVTSSMNHRLETMTSDDRKTPICAADIGVEDSDDMKTMSPLSGDVNPREKEMTIDDDDYDYATGSRSQAVVSRIASDAEQQSSVDSPDGALRQKQFDQVLLSPTTDCPPPLPTVPPPSLSWTMFPSRNATALDDDDYDDVTDSPPGSPFGQIDTSNN